MHVLVSADMEGITGVVHPEDVDPGGATYQECRRLMTQDVNAAVEGFFGAGAGKVTVNDAHNTMRNLVVADLDPRVTYIRGSVKPLGMLEGLRSAAGTVVDAVAFVGYHAGAGRPGVLAHCHLAQGIIDVQVDGVAASEGRLNALVAAEAGVPVVLVTGDDVTCADALEYAPHAQTAVVKEAIDRYAARLLPPARAQAEIRRAAAASLDAVRAPAPPGLPVEIVVRVDAAHLATAGARVPGVSRSAPTEIRMTAPTVLAAYQTFRVVATVIGSAVDPAWG